MAKPKPDLKEIRKRFNSIIEEIWKLWDDAKDDFPEDEEEEIGTDPIKGTYWMEYAGLNDEERGGIRIDIGWLEGVSAVTGWELRRPGPREWSPRDG